ncbi:hypothetical protein HDU83_005695 [Entophlyctis luteolus]|nr:hypothetical protein HDU83_005695 [Entophlyctis luteolus]
MPTDENAAPPDHADATADSMAARLQRWRSARAAAVSASAKPPALPAQGPAPAAAAAKVPQLHSRHALSVKPSSNSSASVGDNNTRVQQQKQQTSSEKASQKPAATTAAVANPASIKRTLSLLSNAKENTKAPISQAQSKIEQSSATSAPAALTQTSTHSVPKRQKIQPVGQNKATSFGECPSGITNTAIEQTLAPTKPLSDLTGVSPPRSSTFCFKAPERSDLTQNQHTLDDLEARVTMLTLANRSLQDQLAMQAAKSDQMQTEAQNFAVKIQTLVSSISSRDQEVEALRETIGRQKEEHQSVLALARLQDVSDFQRTRINDLTIRLAAAESIVKKCILRVGAVAKSMTFVELPLLKSIDSPKAEIIESETIGLSNFTPMEPKYQEVLNKPITLDDTNDCVLEPSIVNESKQEHELDTSESVLEAIMSSKEVPIMDGETSFLEECNAGESDSYNESNVTTAETDSDCVVLKTIDSANSAAAEETLISPEDVTAVEPVNDFSSLNSAVHIIDELAEDFEAIEATNAALTTSCLLTQACAAGMHAAARVLAADAQYTRDALERRDDVCGAQARELEVLRAEIRDAYEVIDALEAAAGRTAAEDEDGVPKDDAKELRAARERVEALYREIEALQRTVREASETVERRDALVREVEHMLRTVEEENRRLVSRLDHLQGNWDLVREEVACQTDLSRKDIEQVQNMTAQMKILQLENAVLEQEKSNLEEKCAAETDRLSKELEQVSELKEQMRNLENEAMAGIKKLLLQVKAKDELLDECQRKLAAVQHV